MVYHIITNRPEKLKNLLIKFKFLIIAIFLIAIAIVIELKSLKPENYEIDSEKFRETLFQKEKSINALIQSFLIKIHPIIEDKKLNLLETFSNLNLNELKQKGFIVAIYVNDTLKFWTDNSIEIKSKFSDSNLNNNVLKLNNAWYYIKNIHEKNLEIFGFILIRNDYSFENEFLVNTFQKDFNLPSSIKLSKVPLSFGIDITDKENQYLFSLVPTNTIFNKSKKWDFNGILFLTGIAFVFLFLNQWIRQIALLHNASRIRIFLILISLLILRFLMLEYQFPNQLYSISFFNPEYFEGLYLIPSLGDFLINSIFILFYAHSFFYIFRKGELIRFLRRKSKSIKFIFGITSMALIILYFNFIILLLESLVMNSSIPLEAHRVLELNLFSLLAYLIFAVLLSSLIIIADKIISINIQILRKKELLSITFGLISIYILAVIALKMEISSESLFFLIFFVAVIIYILYGYKKYHYSLYILLIIIGSAYIALFTNHSIKQKDQVKAKTLISQLINERDKIAEHLLISIDQATISDSVLQALVIKSADNNLDQIKDYLKKKYFTDYFSNYDLNLIICQNYANANNEDIQKNCSRYWLDIIEMYGNKIENTDYYYIDNHTNRVSYLGFVNFIKPDVQSTFKLWIKLDSKLLTQEIGYPDLLIEEKVIKKNNLDDYSYAKYQNGRLISRYGNFPYDLNDKIFHSNDAEYSTLVIDNYIHVIYHKDKNRIVLSRTRVMGYDLLISFSYIFVFFNILLIIRFLVTNTFQFWQQIQLNFKNKLLLAMLFVLALSFILVTAGTIYYNSAQFEKKHNTNLIEKLESVLKNFEFEQEKGNSSDSSNLLNTTIQLNETLKLFSNIYYTDINIYNYKGGLIATSRPEILTRGLIGHNMEPEAFRQMINNEKIRFIQKEKIGKLEYSSAYALFKKNGKQEALFVNLPYFTKPSELHKEISNLIVAVINLYVILFIVIAMISFLMANKITQPLRMLQSKFQKIELGKESEQIVYNKKDEVGALVEEYNRMVAKLAESIDLLAKTERESAWREMAKQIAHEIKNPLTPMKLSVQFLQRSWQDKDTNFESKLGKYTQTLIDQINSLSNIATEFSNFAKMPKAHLGIVDLVVRIEHTVNLFINTENLIIETNIDKFENLLIIADHEQISRVLTNLTKNAIQAIPAERKGFIQILVEIEKNSVLLMVIDNGSGIADHQKEKLFMPSFTTKSSGMGMGLPIVKDIIESANGKIWFETELEKGTTFFVRFPLASNEQIEEYKTEKS
jgi:signal transduction histidine kinase